MLCRFILILIYPCYICVRGCKRQASTHLCAQVYGQKNKGGGAQKNNNCQCEFKSRTVTSHSLRSTFSPSAYPSNCRGHVCAARPLLALADSLAASWRRLLSLKGGGGKKSDGRCSCQCTCTGTLISPTSYPSLTSNSHLLLTASCQHATVD